VVKLIDHFYKPPLDHRFDGEDPVYAVGRTAWLVVAIETTNYFDEMLRLFRNNHRWKYCPVIWGFHACSWDGTPKGRKGSNWHLDIYDALFRAISSPNGYFDVMDCGDRIIEEIIEEISDHYDWTSNTKNSQTIRNWYQDFRKERKIKGNLLPGKHIASILATK
jgi:hypothetical protein